MVHHLILGYVRKSPNHLIWRLIEHIYSSSLQFANPKPLTCRMFWHENPAEEDLLNKVLVHQILLLMMDDVP